MKRLSTLWVPVLLLFGLVAAQTPQQPKKPREETSPEDVIRITTQLVQTDVVVVDNNERIVSDLKLEDFELYDNGKKQELKFLEFVSVETGRRSEGKRPDLPDVPGVREEEKGLSAKEVKRIVAFIIDDLTIPYADLPAVRTLLLDFVNNRMRDGDLVAVIRVVGGKGLLQQFTSDRALLRTAIAAISPIAHPFMASTTPEPGRVENPNVPQSPDAGFSDELVDRPEISSPADELNQFFRGLASLAAASFVIESLKDIPGRKNVVIVSGGIPIFQPGATGSAYSNTTYMVNRLSDAAIRAGVVINTLDPRGLNATPGVVGFSQTPGRSNYEAEIMGVGTGFGRGGSDTAVFGALLAGGSERLGLSTVAKTTGGVSVVNTNDFSAGLDKIMARSSGYYVLAYTPRETFDRKFHKLEVKVRRSGAKIFHHAGYIAREDKRLTERTKEEEIVSAARSPLARRDIDVTPNVSVKFLPDNRASVDIHMLIEARKLTFSETAGRFHTSFDVVGFVLDQLGRQRGGFSETVNLNLTKDNYQRAQTEGLVYSASAELPPGYYQLRSVVREAASGNLGTFSKYLEIPDLKKERLAMSSLFLFAVDSRANATPLLAVRQVNRSQDLRYATVIYNAKLKDGKPQLRSQLIISQGSTVLLREPEQPIDPPANRSSPVAKIGQFGVSKMRPGRYVLTLIITDTATGKKDRMLSRSLDFTVVN